MSKSILLLLAFVVLSKQNFLSFSEEPQKLELKEMTQQTAYTNNIKWKGYELSSPHIITKISWSSEDIKQFGIFEGSNESNFMDAVPLYMFKEVPNTNYVDIKSTASFKYIRYVSPLKSNAIKSEVKYETFKKIVTNFTVPVSDEVKKELRNRKFDDLIPLIKPYN